jgi:multidrug efflux pump
MAVGTVFTLYVVPAFYMLIARDHAAVRAAQPTAPVLATASLPAK